MTRATSVLVVLCAAAAVQAQSPKLKVGSPAPALSVAKWVKGTPVTKLGNGKVHVVEFWATWCGPCRTSIPHLTELAKKYKGKATFVGVSVWENQKGPNDRSYFPVVDKFVKDMGASMNYNVAVDGPGKTMAKTWMEAAGQDGIPAAFIIGRDGKVQWIGHPMGDLDAVLGKVIAGKFDSKAEAKRLAAQEAKERAAQAEQAERMKILNPLVKAFGERDWKAVVAESDKVMKSNPELAPMIYSVRYQALLKTDEPAAYKFASELAAGPYKADPMGLNQVAWMIVDPEADLKSPDYDVAVEAAEKAVALTKESDPDILDTLGLALWKKGNKARALMMQQKAVDIASKKAGYPPATLKELKERLAMMKKG